MQTAKQLWISRGISRGGGGRQSAMTSVRDAVQEGGD